MVENPPKIMVVYGTRPEAIKLAPVIRRLRSFDDVHVELVATSQHQEMLGPIVQRFSIVPDHALPPLPERRGLNVLLAKTIAGLDEVLQEVNPEVILVQGDTTTAFAAAIAGFQHGAFVAHLEAGLRTGDTRAPFPEEANRKLITQIADFHFAPSEEARRNLIDEGVDDLSIEVTGNTVIDALMETASWEVSFDDPALRTALSSGKRVVLITAHRRENLKKIDGIVSAIEQLAKSFSDCVFVYPVHANPDVKRVVGPRLEGKPNVILTESLPYDQFTKLLRLSHLVVTDSGGLQEEAPALGIPVLVLRDRTERAEVEKAGATKLVGTKPEKIVEAVTVLLTNSDEYDSMAVVSSPYGDGAASLLVANTLRAVVQRTMR